MSTVEVRCPVGPRKLFMKLKIGEESGQMVPGNLMEISCWDCSKTVSREENVPVAVVHRFNFLGELVRTVVQPR